MEEQDIYSIELDGLFPELDESVRVHGTAGEILEQIADQWGLEEEEDPDPNLPVDGVYPSTRAIRAHQLLEDRLGKSGFFDNPDLLIAALVQEGLIRFMTEVEYEDLIDKEEMGEYEKARGSLDDEWNDGVWET